MHLYRKLRVIWKLLHEYVRETHQDLNIGNVLLHLILAKRLKVMAMVFRIELKKYRKQKKKLTNMITLR